MDIDELVQAIQTLNAEDAFRARLSLEQWRSIAPYLTRHEIRAGGAAAVSRAAAPPATPSPAASSLL